jgi:hypothetical protein
MSFNMSVPLARESNRPAKGGIPLHGIVPQNQGPPGIAQSADSAFGIMDLSGGKICADGAFQRAGE